MANCTNCGKPLKEGAKFCVSCGTPVPAKSAAAPDKTPAPVRSAVPETPTYSAPATDSVITTLGWLGTLLVTVVPIIGIVLYFVWAFGTGGNLNRRNYCRAALIMMAVSFVLSIIIIVSSYGFILSIIDYL